MTIQAIPLSPVSECVDAQTPLLDALRLMLERDVSLLPLCDGGRWVGLITLTDVIDQIIPMSARIEGGLTNLSFAGDAAGLLVDHLKKLAGKQAAEAARNDLPTLRPDHPLLETALLLTQHGSPLPVVDDHGHLLGMLSRRALLRYLMRRGGL